jgi:hypothetical protein
MTPFEGMTSTEAAEGLRERLQVAAAEHAESPLPNFNRALTLQWVSANLGKCLEDVPSKARREARLSLYRFFFDDFNVGSGRDLKDNELAALADWLGRGFIPVPLPEIKQAAVMTLAHVNGGGDNQTSFLD